MNENPENITGSSNAIFHPDGIELIISLSELEKYLNQLLSDDYIDIEKIPSLLSHNIDKNEFITKILQIKEFMIDIVNKKDEEHDTNVIQRFIKTLQSLLSYKNIKVGFT